MVNTDILGVFKQLLELWLDSSNHKQPYYIGRKIDEIDKRLLQIRTPQEIGRKPKTLRERKFYKANELKSFLLHYGSAVFNGVLPEDYLNHFMVLSDCVHFLLKETISRIELSHVEDQLNKFVSNYELYYGAQSMTYNVHLLSHLVESVKNCGPLWATSNFHFENKNGVLAKLVHGSTDVTKQIATKYLLKLTILQSSVDLNEQSCFEKIHENLYLVNMPKTKTLTVYYTDLMKNKFEQELVCESETIQSYKTIVLNKITYNCELYETAEKALNSFVQFADKSFGILKEIIKVRNTVFVVIERKFVEAPIQPYLHSTVLNTTSSSLICMDPLCIIDKLVLIVADNMTVCSRFPNRFECD